MSTIHSFKDEDRWKMELRMPGLHQFSPSTFSYPAKDEQKYSYFIANVKNTLFREQSVVLLRSFPSLVDNTELLTFSRYLGDIIVSGANISGNPLEDDLVYCVEVKNHGKGVADEEDLLIFSTTSQTFPCHTDGYCNNPSADIIVLLCVRPDMVGGDTLLVHLDNILMYLTEDEIRLLQEPIYPSALGLGPILYENKGTQCIRFNKQEIDRFAQRFNHTFSLERQAVVEHVKELASSKDLQCQFRLLAGDCLVINNRKVLHGRTDFSPQSNRLLKRVWITSENYSWEWGK